jgi:hypothetical protein
VELTLAALDVFRYVLLKQLTMVFCAAACCGM